MSKVVIGVYGGGGFGREVMPLVLKQYKSAFDDAAFVFIDDGADISELNGHPVMVYEKFKNINCDDKFVVFAIANSAVRELLDVKCKKDGIGVLSVLADNTVVLDQVSLGEGSILCHFTMLSSNIRIGKQFHANFYSYVAHDCVIGDYVTFAPNVHCNGNVHIHDHAYIGSGAIIKQGTPAKPLVIGKGAVVGMGAVVTKEVPPGVTVVGNPARPLIKK